MPIAPFHDMGPCFAIWDPNGLAIDLNPTLGGCRIRDSLIVKDILEDGQGETAVDAVDAGRTIELEIPMTRFTWDQLQYVIQGSVRGTGNLTVKNSVGNALFPASREIIIKPTEDNEASIVTSEWTHFFRCAPVIDAEIVFDNSEQRVAKILFKVFPDDASPRKNHMYRYGPV